MPRRMSAVILAAALVAGCGGTVQPTSSPVESPSVSARSSIMPTAAPPPTATPPSPFLSPAASPSPTATPVPTPVPRGTATRLVVASLKIDLPVIALATGKPLLCGVAYTVPGPFGAPGDPKAVYIAGMPVKGGLLPISTAVVAGHSLKGTEVQVFTSADLVYTYTVTGLHRHALNLKLAAAATTPQLWIQTGGDLPGEIQLVADQTGSGEAADHASAHPVAKPSVCP